MYFFVWAKERDQPKQHCGTKHPEDNKPKWLYVGWHDLFCNGMVYAIDDSGAYGRKNSKGSFIHE